MSGSSRIFSDSETQKVELPVFVTPNELIFSPTKRRTLLTIFNPYGNEAQFRIMTTSPERFDVSLIKGTIKPNRRIDISIRLLSNKIDELPEPTEEPQTFDYFRISIQMGSFKGNKPLKAHWCINAELSELDDSHAHLVGAEDKTSKLKLRSMKSPSSQSSSHLNPSASSSSPSSLLNPSSQRSKATNLRAGRTQADLARNGSNVNLVCTICAVACVITLFLPLALDSELCKKAKTYPVNNTDQTGGLLAQLGALLSVSYEMKLGCSFALGLFTYRLISTLPD